MSKATVIILSGYGLNCEDETAHAFRLAGGRADIVHINDLIAAPKRLSRYQILVVPGGFSFGDDTGGGKAYANRLKNHLHEHLQKFLDRDTLLLGICNGFQILTQAGILPGALTYNTLPRYNARWVDLTVPAATGSPWLENIRKLSLPIAHGEGKYYADTQTLQKLQQDKRIGWRYGKGELTRALDMPANPNGSILDIAGVTGYNGRVLGTMPHPERFVYATQHPLWTLRRELLRRTDRSLPRYGDGLQLFNNAINYFK